MSGTEAGNGPLIQTRRLLWIAIPSSYIRPAWLSLCEYHAALGCRRGSFIRQCVPSTETMKTSSLWALKFQTILWNEPRRIWWPQDSCEKVENMFQRLIDSIPHLSIFQSLDGKGIIPNPFPSYFFNDSKPTCQCLFDRILAQPMQCHQEAHRVMCIQFHTRRVPFYISINQKATN